MSEQTEEGKEYQNLESIKCFDLDPQVLADNIVFTINQPWGY